MTVKKEYILCLVNVSHFKMVGKAVGPPPGYRKSALSSAHALVEGITAQVGHVVRSVLILASSCAGDVVPLAQVALSAQVVLWALKVTLAMVASPGAFSDAAT